jgi:hypothetical protein
MTSTDFTFPQPTDDELAAQQPRNSRPQSPLIYASAGAGFNHYDQGAQPVGTDVAGAYSAHSDGSGVSGAVSTPGASATVEANSRTLGKTAMVLSIVAVVLSVAASAILGATVGPTEAASGYYFTDTPDWYQTLSTVLVGLQALCTGLGLTGLVLGIVSAVASRGRAFGIVAIAAAAIAPFVSFGTFVALGFTFA